jgi:hypothetical protein
MGVLYACALSFMFKYLHQSCGPKPMTRVDINDNNQYSNKSYIQHVDYEKIPFKCKIYHEYGHFAKSCPHSKDMQDQDPKQYQWQQPKSKKTNGKTQPIPPQNQRKKPLDPKEKILDPHKKENEATINMQSFTDTNILDEVRESQEENNGRGLEEEGK